MDVGEDFPVSAMTLPGHVVGTLSPTDGILSTSVPCPGVKIQQTSVDYLACLKIRANLARRGFVLVIGRNDGWTSLGVPASFFPSCRLYQLLCVSMAP